MSRILDTIVMPVIEQALFKEVQGSWRPPGGSPNTGTAPTCCPAWSGAEGPAGRCGG